MVICLERGADLHMAQPIPVPLTVSCFSKIQIGFTFLVPAHLGSPGKRAVKRVCVCVCVCVCPFVSLCVFVCRRAYLRNYTFDLHQNCLLVHAYLWPWLDPPLSALRYVLYFRFNALYGGMSILLLLGVAS